MAERLYGDDLAWIHHHGFADFARAASPGLVEHLARAGIRGGRLLDLGCGGGTWMAYAAARGFDVVGVDVSPALLRIARDEVPSAALRVGSIDDVEMPRCAAITAASEVLSYRSPGAVDDTLPARLDRIAAALDPGGMLVCDLMVAGDESLDYRNWREGPGWAVLVESQERPDERLLDRRIVTFREVDGRYRRGEEHHLLDVRPIEEVRELLRSRGFRVSVGAAYGDFALLPRRCAFFAIREESGAPS